MTPGAALEAPDVRPGRLRRAFALTDLDATVTDPRAPRTAHDWVVDTLLFFVSFFGGVLVWGLAAEVAEPLTPREELLFGSDALVGALLCLAVWLRRRWPVPLAIVACALSTWSAASAIAGLVIIWTLVAHRRAATILAVLPAVFAAAAIYPLVHPDPDLPYAVDVVLGTVINAVVVMSALYVRGRRQLAAMELDRARLAARDREGQVARARQLERAQIAREMHDVLGHRLSLVSMHAGALEYRPDAPPAELAEAAGIVRRSAQQALTELREVIAVLREDPGGEGDHPQPTLADLPMLVAESTTGGVRVRFDDGGLDLAGVPTAVSRTAYRIIQEGLTNVRKHAPGVVADLTLRGRAGGWLTLELTNPLPVGGGLTATTPTAPAEGGGTGLVGLVERAELAGGSLEHGMTPAGAFRLVARLPWPA